MTQQEICRHFLRGSCRFGARCRYSHAIPNLNQNHNQSKPSSNPFGFGSQQQQPQQHKPNPFGFGSSQLSQQQQQQQQQQQKPNPFGFGSSQFSQQQQQQQQQKPNPFGFGVQNRNSTAQFQSPSKPFDNKWTRQTSAGSKQADPQSQASVHICTDPESCKQIIAEDFKNEAPQWKLTCYAHYKHLPCDVHGDISPEELRAVAYEEAKQSRSLQSIVERERNLLQSKLSEFENLLRTPYVSPNGNMNSTSQSNTTPTFTGFNQLGDASNSSSPFRSPGPSSAPKNLFGQPGYNPSSSSTSNNLFGQPGFSQNNNQMAMQPSFGRQLTNGNQASAANFSFGKGSNINANANTTGSQLFSSLSAHLGPNTSNSNPSNKQQQQQLSSLSLGFTSAPPEEKQEDSMDDSIWLKEKWSIGEIPERAPPLRFCT